MLRGLLTLAFCLLFIGEANARPYPGHAPGWRPGIYYTSAAPSGATFVASTVAEFATAGVNVIPYNQGTAVSGDVIACYTINNGSGLTLTLGGSGTVLTTIDGSVGPAFNNLLHWGVLTLPDIGVATLTTNGAPAAGGYGVQCSIYHGAGTVVTHGFFAGATSGASTIALTGFAPSGTTKGIGILSFDANNDAGTVSVSGGGTWTMRYNATAVGGGYFHAYGADLLGTYSGAGVTASNYQTADYQQSFIFELTLP